MVHGPQSRAVVETVNYFVAPSFSGRRPFSPCDCRKTRISGESANLVRKSASAESPKRSSRGLRVPGRVGRLHGTEQVILRWRRTRKRCDFSGFWGKLRVTPQGSKKGILRVRMR